MALILIGPFGDIEKMLEIVDGTLASDYNDFCAPTSQRLMIDQDIQETYQHEDCYKFKPKLTAAFEVPNSEIAASKVLLEFFKKNDSVEFSGFTYEINRVDSESCQIVIQFDRISSALEKDFAHYLKKSIAEYMNQINKDRFVECIKAGMVKSELRNRFDEEINQNHFLDIINYFLYQDPIEGNDDLTAKKFDYWYSIAKTWARAPWASYFVQNIGYDRKSQKPRNFPSTNSKKAQLSHSSISDPDTKNADFGSYNLPNLQEMMQRFSISKDMVLVGKSGFFTHINLSYDLKNLKKVLNTQSITINPLQFMFIFIFSRLKWTTSH